MRPIKFKTLVGAALAVATAVTGVTPPAAAMTAPVSALSGTAAEQRDGDMRTVRAALEHKVVQARLRDLGLSAPEVEARLSRLSDAQLHTVALRLDQQRPAGDDDDEDLLIGLGIGLLLVMMIVWLIDALEN